jgi:hypothetical protein
VYVVKELRPSKARESCFRFVGGYQPKVAETVFLLWPSVIYRAPSPPGRLLSYALYVNIQSLIKRLWDDSTRMGLVWGHDL